MAASTQNILTDVQEAAKRQLLFLHPTVRQMARPRPQIRPAEIRSVVLDLEIIEDYPEDAQGHSCFMLGTGHGGRAVHVACSPKESYLAIITAYLPNGGLWSDDYRKRIKP